MGRRYTYKGEAELLITNSLDGPLVLSQDDEVSLPDDDDSLEEHPLFEPVAADAPKRRRKKASDEHDDEDPQTPVPDEPSA